MKNFAALFLLLLTPGCGAEAPKATEAEQFAAAFGGALETVLGGKENVERLRANHERKATPKPVWDTETHDSIYELWNSSVRMLLFSASTDSDKLLSLKLSERTKLDEDRLTLSQMIRENHEDFLDSLEVWPSLMEVAGELLDAEEEKRESAYAERVVTNERLAKKGPMYKNFVRSAEELAAETQAMQEKLDQQRANLESLGALLASRL